MSALIEDTEALASIQQAAELKRKEKLFLKHVGDGEDIPLAGRGGNRRRVSAVYGEGHLFREIIATSKRVER